MPKAGTSSIKAPKQISLRLACLLMAAVMLASALLAGAVCWKLVSDAAEAEMQVYLQNNNAARSSAYQRMADSWTKTLNDVYGDVIFYGDSLTAGGVWEEYFPYLTPVNLGVVGDTMDGLMIRLPQIEALMCEKCFIMIGVNDLIFGDSVEAALQQYDELLQQFARMSDELQMQVYVQSVLPVREDVTVYQVRNADIRRMNEGVRALAEQYGMTYIDVHSSLADQDGALESNYSYDGLHLTELGYDIWQQILIPYLDE